MTSSVARVARTSPALFILACTGVVGDPAGSGNGSTGGPAPERVDLLQQLPEPRLRRLTVAQYRNTIADLLGPGLAESTEIPGDHRISERGFTSAGAAEAFVGRVQVERYEQLASSYAEQVFADEARRRALIGCEPTAASDPCVREFIMAFGRRAWRRPLLPEEIKVLVRLVEDLARDGSVSRALQLAVSGLLQSPHFLYRVELGVPARLNTRAIVAYEMASRLSFAFLDRGPDERLLDAAAAGDLDTSTGVRKHAERLIGDPRAVATVQRFFAEYLQLGALDGLHRNSAVFPDFSPSLAIAFRREIDRWVEEAVFERRRSFLDLLTDRRAFVDQALAEHYGVSHPGGPGTIPLDLEEDGPRAGILATAGFMASHAGPEETSPVRRGWFVRLRLLCDRINPPPADAQMGLPPVDRAQTMRERFAQHTTNAACRGCHEALDPLGFPMEEFDAVGAHRVTDRGQPLDLSGELDGKAFWGTAAMVEVLAADARVARCMTAHLARYFTGLPSWPGEERLGEAILEEADANDIRSLLMEITTSDGFRFGKNWEIE